MKNLILSVGRTSDPLTSLQVLGFGKAKTFGFGDVYIQDIQVFKEGV